jgi:uncharacterized membrane protein HdeD (DUF308 family)
MGVAQDAGIANSEYANDACPALPSSAIRAGIGTLFGVLAMMMPGVAVAGLLLLSGVYLMAAALFTIAPLLDARHPPAAWDRVVQEDIADLAHGDPAIWPIVAVIACVVVLGA